MGDPPIEGAAKRAESSDIGRSIAPIQFELAWSRMRTQTLLETLERRHPGFYEEYSMALIETAGRDFNEIVDQLTLADDANAYLARHPHWAEEDDARLRELVGPEVSARVAAAWSAFRTNASKDEEKPS